MTATNHALTGAVVALSVKQPFLAVLLAFLSHFALDAVPHFGVPPGSFELRKYAKFLVADFSTLFLSVILIAVIYADNFWVILLCMATAAAPDAFWWKYRKNLEEDSKEGVDAINRFHWWIQWKEFPQGIFVELAWLVFLISLMAMLKR